MCKGNSALDHAAKVTSKLLEDLTLKYMPLFRYFSPEDGLQTLSTLELMVTPPKYLNDPFEGSPHIKCEDSKEFKRQKVEELATSRDLFEEMKSVLPDYTFDQLQTDVRRSAPRLREIGETLVPEVDLRIQTEAPQIISSKWGVICFAGDEVNPLMWAHYAESHAGLVIEFRENDPLFSGRLFFKIEYSDEPVTFDASDTTRPDDIELFLRRKSSKWINERESRLVVELSHTIPRDTPKGRRCFIPIEPRLVISVTLGLRTPDNIKAEVVHPLQLPHFGHVELFQIRKNVALGALERFRI
jgi:hypothetical protein